MQIERPGSAFANSGLSSLRGAALGDEAAPVRAIAIPGAAEPLPSLENHRGRGRNAGRYEVSGRGRMRNRGASGGGTLCSGAPQFPQRSCGASWIRNHCPRAAHSGFKHCTVHPGRYCIVLSPRLH